LFSDYILILPIAIIGLIATWKEKNNYLKWLFFGTIILILCMCIDVLLGVCSEYYYFKTYYLLWLVSLYFMYEGLVWLLKWNKRVTSVYFVLYISLILSLFATNSISQFSRFSLNIYLYNLGNVLRNNLVFNQEEMDGVRYILENKEELVNSNNELPTIGSYYQLRWIEAFTDVIPRHNFKDSFDEYTYGVSMKKWAEDEKTQSLVYFKIDRLKKEKLVEVTGGQRLYENDAIAVIKKIYK
jgi:hypothetical protein